MSGREGGKKKPLKQPKKDKGEMIFSIREKYLNSETDSGMNYHGALDERENK